ncbi:MAG: protein kinase domain-containing protein [Bryobacteraceae bacterium]
MASARVVRFGAFRFDPALPELRKGRIRLKVPDQSLTILAMLLEQPGEVVSREAIQDRLWPHGTVVEFENNIHSAVKRLREALSDTAGTPRYIETLPRKGYRFVGRLEPADGGPLQLTPGTLISHYRILGEAGRGAMGVVYKAEDTTLGRMVALKCLSEDLAAHEPALERLRREARMIAALNHPGICTVYELAEVSGRVFLVMEFLEGASLRKRMARGRMDQAELLAVAVQISKALEAAHGQGMVHRDIKPDNLFLTTQGVVKLMDFGLAKSVEPDSGSAEQSSVTGTSGYMSPEQARGQPLDARTDIYSLGRVLTELAGEPPPPRLAPILRKALAADPAERWQSARELNSALEGLVVRRQWPNRFLLAALAAVAIVLVTGLWLVSAPRTRVTQLTNGARPNTRFMAVHGGRILYTSWWGQSPIAEFWSISTQGGEPRQERMPFLGPENWAWCRMVSDRQGIIMIGAGGIGTAPVSLWLAGFDGSKPRRIGEAAADSGYSVSPDLKTLLRASQEGLFARPVDGGPERLVARVDWKTPSYTFWHPSGERIGFLPLKDGPAKVWEVKTDGTGMRPLLPGSPAEQDYPNWSPDGKRLYFVSQGEIYRQGGRRWLGWMRRPEPERLTAGSIQYGFPYEDPTDPREIYSEGTVLRGEAMKLSKRTGLFEPYLDGLSAQTLDYSPDGQWIAYVTYPGHELWKCRRDGSDRVLLEEGLDTGVPRWSPDGKRLAIMARRKGVSGDPYRVYIISAEGGRPELVKGINGPGADPNWSPDGKRLVFAPFVWDVAQKQERYVSIVDLETGEVRMVPGSEDLYSPRWSPDGKRLAAIRSEGYRPVLYDFDTRRWTDVDAKGFGYPTWSKDSRFVYGIILTPNRLVRIEAATGKLEEIRSIKEFRLAIGEPVSWTPDGEAVVLADHSTSEIYRIEVER